MRYKAVISYDGTHYYGWQVQPKHQTIQGELEKALKQITGRKTRVESSGRTDQGVHAKAQVAHFDLKEKLGLPEAVMTDNEITFGVPVRPGDKLRTHQILRSVSDPKTTKLGTGRFWVIDVQYLNQNGELVGVESYTGFGYGRKA